MFLVSLFCVCACFGVISPSAIPMWEYLNKDEKMSYLYSMFANQVEDYCEESDMRNCNRELLKYGLNKLKDMPEDHLDTMDPYQRGAHTLIWDSMMEGHDMVNKNLNKKTNKLSTTTPKPNSYDDQSFSQDFQGQASAKIESVYRVPPPRDFFYTHPQYTIENGPSQYRIRGTKPPVAARPAYTNVNRNHYDDYVNIPLTGPMVVKVHLDGTPVAEQPSLPQDEDLKQYKMSKAKLPSF